MQPARRLSDIKRICVIGGGPAGVAAAKHLLAERCFDTVDIFDQRSDIGGVWRYEPENDHVNPCQVPHTNPEVPLEDPRWLGKNPSRAAYQSPMYARLEANLPKMLMQHSDLDFAKDTQLFPRRVEILNYLNRYANEVKHLIQHERQITSVEQAKKEKPEWVVTIKDLRQGQQETFLYDAVLVSSGHYTVPFIPSYPGIELFNSLHPGTIFHSKWFDDPLEYRDKTVLVVGMGPSGSDIATQIAEFCAKPLLVSTRSRPSSLPLNAKSVPGVAEFVASHKSIRFTDDSQVENIDTVIFCTGYLYSYPFLAEHLRKNLIYPPEERRNAFHPGERCRNVFQHLFYTHDPTLAFLTLPWNIVPFPVAEGQGAVVARAWSGRLCLPSKAEMEQWEHEREADSGTGKPFHKLAPPSDVDYINDLWEWSQQVDNHSNRYPTATGSNKNENAKAGKTPPYWGPRHRWMRINVPAFKKASAERGEQRHHVTTLEELGFHYDNKSHEP